MDNSEIVIDDDGGEIFGAERGQKVKGLDSKTSKSSESKLEEVSKDKTSGAGQTEKKSFHFVLLDELVLLRQIMFSRPFESKHGEVSQCWSKIAKTVGGKYSGERARRHFNFMMDYFNKQDSANLRKTGTEEEYNEKVQLLQDIKDMMKDSKDLKEKSDATKQKEKDDKEKGLDLRDISLKSMVKIKQSAEEAPLSKKRKEDRLLNIMEKQMEMKERQLQLDADKFKFEQEKWKSDDEEKKLMMKLLIEKLNKN